jgi:hypothetical protein
MSSWLKDYQNFIFENVAILAIPDGPDALNLRKKLVTQDAMKYWVQSITHPSLEPNNDGNYENLETYGDAVMKVTYEDILISLHPDISSEIVTNLISTQVWHLEQARLSDEIGLGKWLRSIFVINSKIREDLLESMFGSLMFIGERLIGPGNGYVMCLNAMIKLYGESISRLDLKTVTGTTIAKNHKQELKEIGDKLGWYRQPATIDQFGLPREIKNRFGELTAYELTYRLPPRAIKWMQSRGYVIRNDGILASVKGKLKNDVLEEIVPIALKNLKKYYDIDWEFATSGKKEILPSLVVKQMKRDDLANVYIFSKGDSKYYQLIGEKNTGHGKRKEILLTVINETSGTDKSILDQIYTIYGENGKRPLGDIIHIT